jgi:hypothetical protein
VRAADLADPFGRIGAEVEGEPGVGHAYLRSTPIVTRITLVDNRGGSRIFLVTGP